MARLKLEFEIGGRMVGPGHPCFIIAEAGVNHNGDMDMARRLVDDVVKRVFRGSREELLVQLLERKKLSAKERDMLKRILREQKP